MTKRTALLLAFGASLLSTAVCAMVPSLESVSAQTAPTAAQVAASVQAFYDQTTSVRVRFSQHFWLRAYSKTQSSRGRLTIGRPGRIRFDYDQPRGKVVVSDGTTWTFYEPGDEGDPGQYITSSSADAATSALGFLTGTAQLRRDYRVTLRPRVASTPADIDVIELVPRRHDPRYRKAVLYVDRSDATRGVVRRISIEDTDGNWNRFDFTDFQFNQPVDSGLFRFSPPAGARQIRPQKAG